MQQPTTPLPRLNRPEVLQIASDGNGIGSTITHFEVTFVIGDVHSLRVIRNIAHVVIYNKFCHDTSPNLRYRKHRKSFLHLNLAPRSNSHFYSIITVELCSFHLS